MSKIDDKITEVVGKLEKLVESHGADAIELGVAAVQIQGAVSLIYAATGAAMLAVALPKMTAEIKQCVDKDVPSVKLFIFAGASFMGFMLALINLSQNNIIAAFAPKLRLAGKVLGL